MKIGILSDTHGNRSKTASAARLFKDYGVGAVIHCGDIGGFDVLAELAAVFNPLDVPVYVVHGNCDHFQDIRRFFPANIGIELLGRFGEIELGGKRIAVLHGDDKDRYWQAINSGRFDYIFTGHTHEPNDYQDNGLRCINPGSAGRGHPCTVAVLDLSTDVLESIAI